MTSPEAYGFAAGSPAEACARTFGEELKATDARLKAEGRALLPLDIMIRTICF